MNNWRRNKSEIYNQRPQSGNPSSGNWQPTVPAWEKKFCWEVGAVPWRKLVETKKILHTFHNMLKWDDLAGEEAFNNAKARYWAGLKGLQCDIPTPDPDAYIDDVDWDLKVDPELILDLDRDYVVSENSNTKEGVLIFGDTFAKSRGFTCSGWGDVGNPADAIGFGYGGEWEVKDPCENKVEGNGDEWGKGEWVFGAGGNQGESKVEGKGDEWGKDEWIFGSGGNQGESKVEGKGDEAENGWNKWESKVKGKCNEAGNGWNCDSGWKKWESKVEGKGDEAGNGWNCDSGWNKWESKVNKFGNNRENYGSNNGNYMSRYKTTRFHGDESEFGRNGNYNGNYNGGYNGSYRVNSGRFNPRYKTTRFNSDDQVNNQTGRRTENFVHGEKPCRPINYHGSANKQGNHWGLEKSVK